MSDEYRMEFNRRRWRENVKKATEILEREQRVRRTESAQEFAPVHLPPTTVEVEARDILDLEMVLREAEQMLSLLNSDESAELRETSHRRKLKEAISEVQASIRARGEA